MFLKHDNYIKDRKNVTIFLGEEIKRKNIMIRAVTSSVKSNPNGSARVSENQRDMNAHSKGDLSKLPNDGFKKLPDDVFNMLPEYLSPEDMARLSCVLKEKQSDLNKIAQRVNERLRKELKQEISQTKIVGIQISPGPFRNDIQKLSVLEMQNNKLGTAITVLEAHDITNINEMEWGMIPLDMAARNGDENVVDALIVAGADVNKADERGCTPLLRAIRNGKATVVAALIAAGADVNKANEDECTPLHFAAREGNAAVVDALIAAGADVNKVNVNGWTPLHRATRNGPATVVQALVIAGADVDARNYERRTALQLVILYDHYDNVKNAIKAGKKKLISLYNLHVEKAVTAPIHECESLREPLLQNEPKNLTETQKKQAIKYIKEQSFRTKFKIFGNINTYNDIKKYFWK